MDQGNINNKGAAEDTKPATKNNGQQQHSGDPEKAESLLLRLRDNGRKEVNTWVDPNPVQNEIEEVTPTNNNVINVQLEEATSYWNMAKDMGVTCGTEQDTIIDKLKAMEERGREIGK